MMRDETQSPDSPDTDVHDPSGNESFDSTDKAGPSGTEACAAGTEADPSETEEFNTIMNEVRHSFDYQQWSAEDLVQLLCSPKDVRKVVPKLGRKTNKIGKLVTFVWADDEDGFLGIWFRCLAEFVSLLPGERASQFRVLCQQPQNAVKLEDLVLRHKEQQEQKVLPLLEKYEEQLMRDLEDGEYRLP